MTHEPEKSVRILALGCCLAVLATMGTRPPAAIGPAVRAFEAKCAEKTATRGDLIALKKFIAASAIDGAAKTNWTQLVRKIYQESRKKEKQVDHGKLHF